MSDNIKRWINLTDSLSISDSERMRPETPPPEPHNREPQWIYRKGGISAPGYQQVREGRTHPGDWDVGWLKLSIVRDPFFDRQREMPYGLVELPSDTVDSDHSSRITMPSSTEPIQ